MLDVDKTNENNAGSRNAVTQIGRRVQNGGSKPFKKKGKMII